MNAPDLSCSTLLLVDDEEANLDLLEGILAGSGLGNLLRTQNPFQAVELAREHRPDLVLLDLHMPEMDGLTATQAIRALPGPKSEIPIVAVTAEAMPEQVRKCLAAGMDAHVAKPIRPDVLYGVIEDVLTRTHSARMLA